METNDVCSLAVDCDTAPSVRTNCYRLDSGLWECQCAFHDELYRLEKAAGIQACALAARLCSDVELDFGEESCELSNERSDQDSCTTDVSCRKPINLDAGLDARAWVVRSGWARCERSDAKVAFNCSCLSGVQSSKYALLADGGELACEPLAEFCMSGQEPSFDGEEQCVMPYDAPDGDGCTRRESCGPTMPLAEGVGLVQLQDRFAACVASPGGGSDCYCSDQDSAFGFQLSTPPDEASCKASIPNCSPNAIIERTGPATCENISPSVPSDSDGCGATQRCVQEARIDDRSVLAQGFLTLICRRVEAGKPWRCSCASGPDSAQFELGAVEANDVQACDQASAACLEQMGLFLGPAGNLTSPPEPLL